MHPAQLQRNTPATLMTHLTGVLQLNGLKMANLSFFVNMAATCMVTPTQNI
jgi:hypothetical protein